MLEVKNLSKIYKNKNGIDTKALDNISVVFPEKGMIFLLGKSGSGKSTLLNICGGLDDATKGEIIVKGRSSKDFNQSDFDSYRNTFIGFVFQEYNILNEFTIEENIGLALELQGKQKNKEAINKLLKEVDLEGYAKRKPNTLSGGQKQRIAIARALIKEPEIIMADEPTGALDSSTGTQVLETLKKLSKDKLVIVVSHDREFAENYGDRILELKDGKIISDVSKTYEKQKDITTNLSMIGDILHIKKGSDLNETDFEKIKMFLTNSKNDVILASHENDVKNFKIVNRITDSGEKEVFKETIQTSRKKYSKEDSKFIRSKLPLKHAIRIGGSSLKYKKIRLFFTILLCTISFIIFGVLSTMTFYNSDLTFKQTLKDSNLEHMVLNKYYKVNEKIYYEGEKVGEYPVPYQTSFSKEEFENYKKEYGKDIFYGINVEYKLDTRIESDYWRNQIYSFAHISEDNSLYSKITGKYPTNNNEICISSYTANVIYNNKIYDSQTGKTLNLSSPSEIIGKNLFLGNNIYKVVGILDTGSIDPKFDELKVKGEKNNKAINEYLTYMKTKHHLIAFVSEGRITEIANENTNFNNYNIFSNRTVGVGIETNGQYSYTANPNVIYMEYSLRNKSDEVIELISGKSIPQNNETIISSNLFLELIIQFYNKKVNEGDSVAYKYQELAQQLQQKGYYQDSEKIDESKFIKFTEGEIKEKFNLLVNEFKKQNVELKIAIKPFDINKSVYIEKQKELTVVGTYKLNTNEDMQSLLLSDNLVKEIWDIQKANLVDYSEYETNYEAENTPYINIYIPYDKTEKMTQSFLEIYNNVEYREDDSMITLTGDIIETLKGINEIVDSLSEVFLYVGIVLAIFSVMLFSNFISISISYKKKEIGVLRAIGARSMDVFKIFFSESFIITLICVGLSVVGNLFITKMLNNEFSTGIGVSIFVFGITSFSVLIVLALLTAIVATLIPVYNAARKKPVDSIRSI